MTTPNIHQEHCSDGRQRLAAEQSQPLKDAAGIIIPQGVDAYHRAVGLRRALESLNDSNGPDQAHNHEDEV